MIGRFERFSFAISAISHYWHKLVSDEMEKYGLKGPYAIYLVALSHYDDGITAANLAELCGKDKSDVSRVMAVMEKKGLVYKEGSTPYRALLKLTDQGKAAAEHVHERARVAVELVGAGIEEEQRVIFYECLEKIAGNIRSIGKAGLPDA